MKPHTHITSALLLIGALCYAPLTFAQAWEDLSSDSQQVLRPLRINWEELSTAQKQSWLKRVPELKAMPKSSATLRNRAWPNGVRCHNNNATKYKAALKTALPVIQVFEPNSGMNLSAIEKTCQSNGLIYKISQTR